MGLWSLIADTVRNRIESQRSESFAPHRPPTCRPGRRKVTLIGLLHARLDQRSRPSVSTWTNAGRVLSATRRILTSGPSTFQCGSAPHLLP